MAKSVRSIKVDAVLRWLLLLLLILWIVPLLYIYSWGGQKITLPDSNLTAQREAGFLLSRLEQLKATRGGAADIAAAHLALANHLSHYSFYADAEREYMSYLSERQKLERDNQTRYDDYLIVASALRDIGKFPEAKTYLEKALQCTSSGDYVARARILNSLGLLHYLWGQSGRAEPERHVFFALSDGYYREAGQALKDAPPANCAESKSAIQCVLKNNYDDLLREYQSPTVSR